MSHQVIYKFAFILRYCILLLLHFSCLYIYSFLPLSCFFGNLSLNPTYFLVASFMLGCPLNTCLIFFLIMLCVYCASIALLDAGCFHCIFFLQGSFAFCNQFRLTLALLVSTSFVAPTFSIIYPQSLYSIFRSIHSFCINVSYKACLIKIQESTFFYHFAHFLILH